MIIRGRDIICRNRYLKGVGRRFFSILLVCMIMGVRLIGTTVINAASSIAVRIMTSDGQTAVSYTHLDVYKRQECVSFWMHMEKILISLWMEIQPWKTAKS